MPGDYQYTRKLVVPGGEPGSRETLKLMRDLARDGKKHPDIRRCAQIITQPLAPKDHVGEAKRCFYFVQNNIRYLRDIVGVEVLQTPDKTLEIGAGDCDDKSTLLASLLLSIGHPCRFLAIANIPKCLYHVLVETKIGPNWVSLDATEPHPFGWRPRYNYFMVMHV